MPHLKGVGATLVALKAPHRGTLPIAPCFSDALLTEEKFGGKNLADHLAARLKWSRASGILFQRDLSRGPQYLSKRTGLNAGIKV